VLHPAQSHDVAAPRAGPSRLQALASTSAGFAWAIGKADNRVTVDEVCDHLTALCAAVDLPVNADFEGGFAIEPEKVGVNVARAALMRSTASLCSNSGLAASPVESSIERPATPVFAARATLTPTFSGSIAKPPSKSAFDGQIDRGAQRRQMTQTSSTVTRLVSLADGPGKPALVEAKRLEAEMGQRAGAADVMGIGQDEAPALMHLAK